MRASTVGLGGWLVLLALAGGCGDGGTDVDAGAATDDAGTGGSDAGRDAGSTPTDAGQDAGQDAGPSCTTGCGWVELALGSEFSCARRENGAVRCWGRAQNGELGDGAMRHVPGCTPRTMGATPVDCSARPVDVSLGFPAASITAHGGVSACATSSTGELWCWGSEAFRVGDMPAGDRFSPEQFPEIASVSSASDSYLHLCVVQQDGTPLCVGENGAGQIGVGNRLPQILSFTPVVRRDESAPATDGGGAVLDAGVPTPDAGPSAPVALTGVLEIGTSTAFGSFTCARTAADVYCWGGDESGQLGTGDETLLNCMDGLTSYSCTNVAVRLAGIDGSAVTQLAVGRAHACARMSDGTVMCWGDNRSGQLGLGDATQRTVPTLVPGLTGVSQVVAGSNHTCARSTDGSIRCWGLNNAGQLGDGVMDHTTRCSIGTDILDCAQSPVDVGTIDDASFLATGRNHTCAIRGTEQVWCWGDNDKLQLGDGPRTVPQPADRAARFAPVQVQGL